MAVNHNFRDAAILNERLKDVESSKRIVQPAHPFPLLSRGRSAQTPVIKHAPLDKVEQLVVVQDGGDVQSLADFTAQRRKVRFLHHLSLQRQRDWPLAMEFAA
ncbi:hypothetical protein D3C81_952820 [compost metagenome]